MQHGRVVFLIAILFAPLLTKAKGDSCTFFQPARDLNRSRFAAVAGTEALVYGSGLAALNGLWYKDYTRTPFHYFNDNREWMQVDKMGHAFSSYQLSGAITGLYQWTGLKPGKALVFGASSAMLFLTTIEALDGFSSGWGASGGDMLANTAGCGLYAFQQLGWKEQRMQLKFSYAPTGFASYRPQLLGATFAERLFKDYNGQTYWLSVNLHSFMKEENRFPKWLNLALGYGANGMIGGSSNPLVDKDGNALPTFPRYRQFYLSFDVDLRRLKSRYPFLNTVLYSVGFLKIPFTALEYNTLNGFRLHPFFF